MTISKRHVRAVFRKELREYRRTSAIVVTMAVIPLIFLILPMVVIFTVPASSADSLRHEHFLLYMLGIPAIVPAVVAAYSVVGERQQGTLEPLLTTPIRREELLLGKGLAVGIPSVAVSYAVYALVLAGIELFANPAVSSALLRWPDILAQVLFTPLLTGWSIWVGMAISIRANDVRVAHQLGMLVSLPPIVLTSMIAFNAIHATLGLAVGVAIVLLLANGFGWRIVSPMFDRERLVTGTRS